MCGKTRGMTPLASLPPPGKGTGGPWSVPGLAGGTAYLCANTGGRQDPPGWAGTWPFCPAASGLLKPPGVGHPSRCRQGRAAFTALPLPGTPLRGSGEELKSSGNPFEGD